MIHIGDGKDGRVEIPVHHTGVFGQTGVGKTRLLKYMMAQARAQGFKVLIFDSKVTGAEFDGIGQEIAFYLEESTDPDVFRSLLEGMRTRGHGNMERYRGAFIEVCDGTKSFAEIERNLKYKLADSKIRGYTKAMYAEIYYDTQRLLKLLADERFVHNEWGWRGGEQVARVPTHRLPNIALQGLVVRSMVENVLKHDHKVIVLVDEAPNFVNQKKYNPAKDALQQLDAQGRKPEIFGWYSGQTITGFDKANMKNLWYWIMGREMEKNEAKDVYDTQTTKARTVDEIKRMKVREFIVSTPDGAQVVMVPKVGEAEMEMHESQSGGPRNDPSQALRSEPEGESGSSRIPSHSEPRTAPPDTMDDAARRSQHIEFKASSPEFKLVEPEPKTKQLAAFTLEVTRLESDSAAAKVAYIVKENGILDKPGIAAKALEYGWTELHQEHLRKHVLPAMTRDGLLVREGNSYRFPEHIKVEKIEA